MEGQEGFSFLFSQIQNQEAIKGLIKKKKGGRQNGTGIVVYFIRHDIHFPSSVTEKKNTNLCQQTANTKATIQSLC